ncbi:MAG TPA: hypothetical protein VJ806_16800 [Luteimonas sp.]|nr:hypothetical protein [Luteimonas sp.]
MQTTTIMIRAALALLLCLACASALVQGSPPGPPVAATPAKAVAPSEPLPVACVLAARTADTGDARL